MGGSGGYFPTDRPLEDLRGEALAASRSEAMEAEINDYLNRVLASVNDRDTELVQDRLDSILSAISDLTDESIQTLFGGSVAKHTYVDGISDVDALVIVGSDASTVDSPNELIAQVAERVGEKVFGTSGIDTGELAVTVNFDDGMEIQLLPALRAGDQLMIASSSGEGWSAIDPRGFAGKLSEQNARLNGRLVPTIKLAKTVLGNFIDEGQRPSGYHVESLAIQAFREYDGSKTPKALLARFFSQAAEDVLRPISDSTGQSVHVDGYLGEADSQARRVMAHNLNRIRRRIEYSTSIDDWRRIVGEDVGV